MKGIGHVNKNIANGRGTRVVVGLVFNGQGDPCHNLSEGAQTLPGFKMIQTLRVKSIKLKFPVVFSPFFRLFVLSSLGGMILGGILP